MGLLAVPAFAQGEPEPIGCTGTSAVFSDGKAFRLWVVRRGAMIVSDALRPLSRDEIVVLQIVVNGRVATAFGPDLSRLRRGGPPAALEEEQGGSITWDPGIDSLPPALRIVAEDGRVVFERLAFSGCEEAPAGRVPVPVAAPNPNRPGVAPRPARPAVALPQGALPESALPRGGLAPGPLPPGANP